MFSVPLIFSVYCDYISALPTMQTPPESNRWPVSRVVRLECNADGNPKPKITWYFNGTPITEAKIGRYEVSLF